MFWTVVLLFSAICSSTQAANILYINGIPSPSHFIWHKALINGLAARGHNVTALSVDIEGSSSPNVSYIQLEGVYEGLNEEMHLGAEMFEMGEMNPFAAVGMFNRYVTVSCELTLETKGLRQLLDYSNEFKFDVIISEYLNGPCLSAVTQHKFGRPPYIAATAFNGLSTTSMLSGAYSYPGSVPDYMLDMLQNMTYFERIANFFYDHYVELLRTYDTYPKVDKIVREIYPDIPYVGELDREARIVLMNSDPAVQNSEASMPNVISVGGMQIVEPKELPEDLKIIVGTASNGVILFSLGTHITRDILGDNRISKILSAMDLFPQYRFIWDFEFDIIPAKVPRNVFMRKSIPQNDLLAHPKIKMFITNGGLLNTQAAIHHGVPIIGFPIFAGQHKNINYCVERGVGKRLPLMDFKTSELADAIMELLMNNSYRENMSNLSKIFRDQKETPLERAIWWVEWVLRNPNNSQVLQSNSIRLDWSAKYSFDVIGGLVLAGLILILVPEVICCVVMCRREKFLKTKRE